METAFQNPLTAKLKLPGRTFQLPSRGALYNNGEVTTEEGEVHVHPMSALTEIDLKNPDLLFNGKAIEAVCAECVPEIKKPTELFGRDIDALMLFLRLVTYGPNFEISLKHTCQDAKQHSYTVDLESLLSEIRYLDPTQVPNYEVTLPNAQVVKLQPVRFAHMIKLFQLNAGKTELTPDDVKSNIVQNLLNLIVSVDGISERKLIEDWIKKLTTPMQNRITEQLEKMNEWGPKQTVELTCKDCGEKMNVELPLNPVSFFTE